MKLSSMRYKDYVWPHNPRVYEMNYRRDVAALRVPFGAYVLQDMGRRCRVLRGEGAFAGAEAYADFRALAELFYDSTPGVLVHPLWDSATAYFVSLELKQEPAENYVAYAFEFWECYNGYDDSLSVSAVPETVEAEETVAWEPTAWELWRRAVAPKYHIVAHGDCLWSIARNYQRKPEELIALNPQLRNPNLIRAGERLRVR